jgi:hypothetical protein
VAQLATQKGKQMKNRMKPAKTEMLKARCEPKLKEDVEQIALLKSLDPADIIRLACVNYVRQVQAASNIVNA